MKLKPSKFRNAAIAARAIARMGGFAGGAAVHPGASTASPVVEAPVADGRVSPSDVNLSDMAAKLAVAKASKRGSTPPRVRTPERAGGRISFASSKTGCYVVTLDGRTLKTPERTEVLLPTEAAAVAIAAEWESQDTHIMPHLMPLTRLAMTALDVVPKTRQSIIDGIMPYLETDTVWFWEEPERFTLSHQLHALQEETYTPILDWMEDRFGIRPETTTGLMVQQPELLISNVREWVDGLDDWQLAALDQSVRSLKSMCLATALLQYHLSPEDAAKYEPPAPWFATR